MIVKFSSIDARYWSDNNEDRNYLIVDIFDYDDTYYKTFLYDSLEG